MTGYFNNPEAIAALDADGWLHTGDLGRMDAAGYCRVLGRLKDIIIRGSENIYPREIEQLSCGDPVIADAAVVGVHDATWGCPEPLRLLLTSAPRSGRFAKD